MTCKEHTLESIIKIIYPLFNSSPLFFTFLLKLGLYIFGYLIHLYIFNILKFSTPKMLKNLSQEALHQYSKIYSHKKLSIDPQKGWSTRDHCYLIYTFIL